MIKEGVELLTNKVYLVFRGDRDEYVDEVLFGVASTLIEARELTVKLEKDSDYSETYGGWWIIEQELNNPTNHLNVIEHNN